MGPRAKKKKPQRSNSAEVEGLSEELPIHLLGDKADDIRSLLKYLYAPVIAIRAYQVQDIPVTELNDILAVTRLANKYDMSQWQTWALNVTMQLLTKGSTSVSSAQYRTIYDLSHMLSANPLRNKVITMWVNMIERGVLPIWMPLMRRNRKGIVASSPSSMRIKFALFQKQAAPHFSLSELTSVHWRQSTSDDFLLDMFRLPKAGLG
ncbi:hypothetical protein B0H13DRAFT_1855269 [Mycena leptocephala]|nr:hypothetical protein B0H13DRAFT_1855269 [Mycena leptocephala]